MVGISDRGKKVGPERAPSIGAAREKESPASARRDADPPAGTGCAGASANIGTGRLAAQGLNAFDEPALMVVSEPVACAEVHARTMLYVSFAAGHRGFEVGVSSARGGLMLKLVYKPPGMVVSVLAGLLASPIYKRVWMLINCDDETLAATERHCSWSEVLVAALLQGAIFGFVEAPSTGRSRRFERATSQWPEDQ